MSKITRRDVVKSAAIAPLAMATGSAKAAVPPTDRFDVVVAGAGHNSLICAAYLAKAGNRVLVLEGRPTIGGGCKTAEVCLPGFREDLCSSAHNAIRNNPFLRDNELKIFDYGLEYLDPDPVMHIPFLDGTGITVWRDVERTAEGIALISKKDAATFRKLTAELKEYSAAPRDKKPRPRVWQRRYAMSGYDLLKEFYESYQMRAASLACGHFSGLPGSDADTGDQAFILSSQALRGRWMPKGGSGMLTEALGRMLEAHNAVILTNMPVTEFIIEGGKCVGVRCADGSSFRAQKAVVSTVHIKHMVNMAPKELWGPDFLDGVEMFQPEHAMFAFHYATKEPPLYPLSTGGTIATAESAIMAKPESIFRLNYDQALGELNLDDLPLQIVTPSVYDPTRAPNGHHTLKVEGTLPYALKEGPEHWDKIKEDVAATLLERLRRHAPNLTPDKIIGKFLTSPLDIERMNPAMWRGSVHHGAENAAQMGENRPVPGWAEYRMPIPGLYQTGACTDPGGSITGFPGRNAASAILKDFGTTIEAVVKT